jgi:hypothetical protein
VAVRRFVALTSASELRAAHRAVARLVRDAGARRARVRLHDGPRTGWYLAGHDLWLVAHELPNRFRNAFGPGLPAATALVWPSVQLNVPKTRGSSHPRARFLRGPRGELWIAHTGTLGGRVTGISRSGFIDFLGGRRVVTECVIDDDRAEPLYLLGTPARGPALLDAIARLVHAAHDYRAAVAELGGPPR